MTVIGLFGIWCGKPLTSGWVKNGAGKPYGFYFGDQKGCRASNVRKELLEAQWVALLGMMEPREELLNRIPSMVAAAWKHRKERAEEERRQLTTRLTEQKVLHKQTIEARVRGKISDENFTTMKDSIASEIKLFEKALTALDEEKDGMQALTKTTEYRLKHLALCLQNGSLKDKVELQFSLWSDGLRWTKKDAFLNKANSSLFQQVEEMVRDLKRDGGR